MRRKEFIKQTSILSIGIGAFGRLHIHNEHFTKYAAGESSSNDVTKLTLKEAADQLRSRRVSPVELTEACLRRIERVNPVLNAFITVTADSALDSARKAESEIRRGIWRGPLHGIPVALKDLFDTAGVRTTAASAVYKDRIPTEDAEVVRRLKQAGAVLVGKTNMHEFAYGGTSAVSYFGAVRNPWNTAYTAGGSSGGSAVAVAAGMCYGAFGSDTAASIRQPAAFCGIVGLKPTYGLLSTRGVIPLSWTFDHVGPLARTVADTALLVQSVAGYDPLDISSRSIRIQNYNRGLGGKVSSFRIGVARGFFFADLDREIEVAVSEALRVLGRITAGVRDVTLAASTKEALRSAVRSAEAYAYHAEFVEKQPELYQPETLTRLRAAADTTTTAYILGLREVDQTRRLSGEVFKLVDIIVTPTVVLQPAVLSDVDRDVMTSMSFSFRSIRNTSPFNVYGWPTLSVPCGFTRAGLPIGMQLSGPNGSEATVLQVAHAYEQATEWHKRLPPV